MFDNAIRPDASEDCHIHFTSAPNELKIASERITSYSSNKRATLLFLAKSKWFRCVLIFLSVFANSAFRSDVLAQSTGPSTSGVDRTADIAFFENRIRPILNEHCFECHSARAAKLKGELMLDSRARVIRGGESGAAVVPDKPDESPLLLALQYDGLQMPPKGKLPANVIEDFRRWIQIGAPWPNEPEPTKSKTEIAFDLKGRKESHWVWKSPVSPPMPSVQDIQWPKQDIDRFILAKLEAIGLAPAPAVDRRTLIRRLSFDLLGLPPLPEDVERFDLDASIDATQSLVDRLLQSEHFGEQWGRHWLDLVRFAESRGHEFDADIPNAFQYRDYVIRALNQDVPFDQFVAEHIAGDLLEHPRRNPERGFNESLLGTGFWFLGEWVHSPVDIRKDETDRFDNMIDVMSKAFLGLTVGCARCHDHKFDAISSRDYYALTGFLQGAHYRQARFETIEIERQISKELKQIDATFSSHLIDTICSFWQANRSRIESKIASASSASEDNKLSWKPASLPEIATNDLDHRVVLSVKDIDPITINQDGFIFSRSLDSYGLMRMLSNKTQTSMPEFVLTPSIQNDPFWNGLIAVRGKPTNLRSRIESIPRPGRTFLTPTFEVMFGRIACLVRGSGHVVACVDSHRLVEGPLHAETIIEIKQSQPNFEWVHLNLERYIGHRVHLEFTPATDEVLEIFSVLDCKQSQKLAFRPADSESLADLLNQSIEALRASPKAYGDLRSAHFDALNWLLRNQERVMKEVQGANLELEQIIQSWCDKRNELRRRLPNDSQVAMSMIDGTGENDRLLIRGNSSTPGNEIPRRFLEAIDGPNSIDQIHGSGRLELARRINASSNPLTSRVIVNRVWHHLMGRGIVLTVDDFGILGQPPTHPELLDYLAIWFDRNGKSIKKLIRMIVLSQSYQMSCVGSSKSAEKDPKNEYWQHANLKRLSAESIRDSLLAVSGSLNNTMYGDSVPVHLTSFMDGRGKPSTSGPLDGHNRRSIYLAIRRNFLSPFMMTFDMPNPFSSMGRRNVSNVPAQALILMNDPFVSQCAESWAKKVLEKQNLDDDQRVDAMYRASLARPPSSHERQLARQFLDRSNAASTESSSVLNAWTDFAHAMFNLKEFIYLR